MHALKHRNTKNPPAAAPKPAKMYPPGYFTALVFEHDWPPGWVSQWEPDTLRNTAAHQRGSRAAKAAAAKGTNWAADRLARESIEATP